MVQRTLYSGEIRVAADDHRHTVDVGDDDVDEEIPGLDVVVTRATMLTFTLDYPFERPYAGRVYANGGITLRAVIDAVRKGFRAMYANTSAEDVPHLENKRVTGSYGTAMHVIDDLVIEAIVLDDGTRELDIGIGS